MQFVNLLLCIVGLVKALGKLHFDTGQLAGRPSVPPEVVPGRPFLDSNKLPIFSLRMLDYSSVKSLAA